MKKTSEYHPQTESDAGFPHSTDGEEPVLSVRNLRKSYKGKTAVDGITIEVRKGEIFGLIGANGAGKTTTIECALGVKTRDEGEISVLGMDPVRDRKKVFARVGVQFQETRFQDRITVREACETTAALYQEPKRHTITAHRQNTNDRPATRDWKPLLLRFGLAGKENAAVQTLSGGERQKLAIVLALIPNPELLFLDELTTGLDPAARRGVWQFLKELRDAGITIVLTSHFMDEVEYLCGRVAIISRGRIVREGSPAQIIEQLAAQQAAINNLEEAFLACIAQEERAEYRTTQEGVAI